MSKWSPSPVNDELGAPLPRVGKRPHTKAKRTRIIHAAKRHFAKHGYEDARMQDLAKELGIAKGSIFQHFGTKKRLLLEALRSTVSFHQTYLDAPTDVVNKGFFATLRYWFEWADSMSPEEWIGFRLWIIGTHATGLDVRREISRLWRTEDPPGALAFIRFGIERGQVRTDIDPGMLAKTLNLMVDGFLEARLAEELDPGFFRNNDNQGEPIPDRIDECLELIRSALGSR